MAIWHNWSDRAKRNISQLRNPRSRKIPGLSARALSMEPFEERVMLAIGPQLVAVFPDASETAGLAASQILHIAPSELIFRFDSNIDLSTLTTAGVQAIQVKRAGADHVFGTSDDVTVATGFFGVGTTSNELIVRFANDLPTDFYQISIAGTLKGTNGQFFNNGSAYVQPFTLQLGPQVVSVVPQPVTRAVNGTLSQALNEVDVYFNVNDPLNVTSAQTKTYYQLINTGSTPSASTLDDTFVNPTSVTYNPATGEAVLLFASNVSAGTYRLRVGNNDPLSLPTTTTTVAAGAAGSSFATADNLPTLFTATTGTQSISLSGAGATIGGSPVQVIYPGGNNEPGTRNINVDSHLFGTPDTSGVIPVYSYNFQALLGTVLGAPAYNVITDVQKQRIREILQYYSNYLGVEFVETADQGATIGTGDVRAVDPNNANPIIGGITGPGEAIMNEAIEWGSSEPGGQFFKSAMQQIGFLLGLGYTYELPALTIQGLANSASSPTGPATTTAEPVFPGDADILLGQNLHPPVGNDINTYQFALNQSGQLNLETFAQRLQSVALQAAPGGFASVIDGETFTVNGTQFVLSKTGVVGPTTIDITSAMTTDTALAAAIASVVGTQIAGVSVQVNGANVQFVSASTLTDPLAPPLTLTQSNTHSLTQITPPVLNSVITLFDNNGNIISRNDDYYGSDSFVSMPLTAGTYYVAVTSTGNTNYNPAIANTGFGGTTEGAYQLRMTFTPSNSNGIKDANGVLLDGDGDGTPGGIYNFWFKVASAAQTIFVDKATGVDLPPTLTNGAGTLTAPFKTISFALGHATPGNIVRIEGNFGTTNNPTTPVANWLSYNVGFDSLGRPLSDGSTFQIPQNVTVMVDAGAVIKLHGANIEVGTLAQGSNHSGGALQVLGTPTTPVDLTSYYNNAFGTDPGNAKGPLKAGDWGGLVFHDDSDQESSGIFLNYVNNANISYGGGQVSVNSVLSVYDPVDLISSRPAITFNTITNSADAAVSADPNSFQESEFQSLVPDSAFQADYSRVGPVIHGNTLANNSINGLFVRIRTDLQSGLVLDPLTVSARFSTTDMVYVIEENLEIQGQPGGTEYINSVTGQVTDAGAPNAQLQVRPNARLSIDPGVIVKMGGARIETEIGSQFIAEGTAANPITFTSVFDDRYGAGGTFDTTNDGSSTSPAAGDWGGLFFGPTSTASVDHALITFGGGKTTIEGGFGTFDPVEIHQAKVRIADSTLENNAAGGDSTDRSGRSSATSAVIFVRGAQPVIVNNTIQNNDTVGANSNTAAISVNVNSLNSMLVTDWGDSVGPINIQVASATNMGPLVRGNKLGNNPINGMIVRGGTVTTDVVWDDTDIVHVLEDLVTTSNQFSLTGTVRLQSTSTESLVVKLFGPTAGFAASGTPLDINDRYGGAVQIIGTPTHPVIMTSLNDTTAGAGFTPAGQPQVDTSNKKGALTPAPAPGDWAGITLDTYSNDTNIDVINEAEQGFVSGADTNSTPPTAQFVGILAPNAQSGDNNSRLGFTIHGSISQTFASPGRGDVDVYSFQGTAGTTVWFDMNQTASSLDSVVELVDANGAVLARSDNAIAEQAGTSPLVGFAQPMQIGLAGGTPGPFSAPHFFSTNPLDAGMRLDLPGAAGSVNTYYVRVRASNSSSGMNDLGAGLTKGEYQLQIRLQNEYQFPGSVVRYADIRDATNAVNVIGKPEHSPLEGDTSQTAAGTPSVVAATGGGAVVIEGETFTLNNVGGTGGTTFTLTKNTSNTATGFIQITNTMTANDVAAAITSAVGKTVTGVTAQQSGSTVKFVGATGITQSTPHSLTTLAANISFDTAQDLGNLLANGNNEISVAGALTPTNQVAWFKFELNYDLVHSLSTSSNSLKTFAAMFAINYADGLNRPDTTLSIFDQSGNLILVGRDSDVPDAQPIPATGANSSNQSSGSFGTLDPTIGSVQLPAGATGPTTGGSGGPTTDASSLRTYYVAVSSNQNLPTILDATFKAVATNPLVRLEPVDSMQNIINDTIGGSNTVASATAPLQQAFPGTTVQQVNNSATPLTLGDVVLYVNSQSDLYTVNPLTGQPETLVTTNGSADTHLPSTGSALYNDIAMRSDGRLLTFPTGTGKNNTANTNGTYTQISTADGTIVTTAQGGLDAQVNPINTMVLDATTPINPPPNFTYNYVPPKTDSGVAVNAMSFGNNTFGGSNSLFVVGDRAAGNGILETQNLLFALSPNTGAPLYTEISYDSPHDTYQPSPLSSQPAGTASGTSAIPQGTLRTGVDIVSMPATAPANDPSNFFNDIRDGQQFQIGNSIINTSDPTQAPVNPGTVFEFDSGPMLYFPQSINANGTVAYSPAPASTIQDGDSFRLTVPALVGGGTVSKTFVFKTSGSAGGGAVTIPLNTTDTPDALGAKIVFAVNTAAPDFANVANYSVHRITFKNANALDISSTATSLAFRGFLVDGAAGVTLATQIPGNFTIPDPIQIPFVANETAQQLANAIATAINTTRITTKATGVAAVQNGESFTITTTRGFTTFQLIETAPVLPALPMNPTPGDIPIFITPAMTTGTLVASAINDVLLANTPGVTALPGLIVQEGEFFTVNGVRFTLSKVLPTGGGIINVANTDTAPQVAAKVAAAVGTSVPGVTAQAIGSNAQFVGATSLTESPFHSLTIHGTLWGITLSFPVGGSSVLLVGAKSVVPHGAPPNGQVTSLTINSVTYPDGAAYNVQATVVQGVAQVSSGASTQSFFVQTTGMFASDLNLSLNSGTNPTPLRTDGSLSPGSNQSSDITGIAFVPSANGGLDRLFAVSGAGAIYEVNKFNDFDGTHATTPDSATLTLLNIVTNANGGRVSFTGLTAGPPDVENGAYKNMMIATDTQGNLWAFNSSGQLAPIFLDGATHVSTGLFNLNGVAFSTLDYNLWHVTTDRGGDPGAGGAAGTAAAATFAANAGHGITQSFDYNQNRDFTLVPFKGGNSFYFGLDDPRAINGQAPSAFNYIQTDGTKPLTGNEAVYHGYNLPGGAAGSLVSQPFSLAGDSAADKPTLYFNYALDTQDANGKDAASMQDSFRVFASTDGANWTELVTNNSTTSSVFTTNAELPSYASASGGTYEGDKSNQQVQEAFDQTGLAPVAGATNQNTSAVGWRQARVDLGDFAGKSNVTLRFDFSTAGSMGIGAVDQGGVYLSALPGSQLQDGQTFVLNSQNSANQTFTFRSGLSLTVPAGGSAAIPEGEQFTVNKGATSTTFTLTHTTTTGPGIININDSQGNPMSADAVAQAIDDAFYVRPFVVTAPVGGGAAVQEGETLTVNGTTFQLTKTGSFAPDNIPIFISSSMSAANVAAAIDTTLLANTLGITVPVFGGSSIHEGETFTINHVNGVGGTTFTLTENTSNLGAGFIQITNTMSPSQVATAIAAAVGASVPGVTAQASGLNVQFVGATTITLSSNSSLTQHGTLAGVIPQLSGTSVNLVGAATVAQSSAHSLILPITAVGVTPILSGSSVQLSGATGLTLLGTPGFAPTLIKQGSPLPATLAPTDVTYNIDMSAGDVSLQIASAMDKTFAGGVGTISNPSTFTSSKVVYTASPDGNSQISSGTLILYGHSVVNLFAINGSTFAGTAGPAAQNVDRPFTPLAYSNTLPGDQFGVPATLQKADGSINYNAQLRAQNNAHEGVYIDDIVVGFAGRGEMVTGTYNPLLTAAPAVPPVTTFTPLPVDLDFSDPQRISLGVFQLDIRPATQYAESVNDSLSFISLLTSYDINDRFTQGFTLVAIPAEQIVGGAQFQIATAIGTFTFQFAANATDLATITLAGNTPILIQTGDDAATVAIEIETAINNVPLAKKFHVKAEVNATGTRVNLFGDVDDVNAGPLGLLTFGAGALGDTPIGGLTGSFGGLGDTTPVRVQGYTIIQNNRISNSLKDGIAVAPQATRDAAGNPINVGVPGHTGSVANLVSLNTAGFVPGMSFSNNLIVNSGQAGILFSGSPTTDIAHAIPFGRIVNNTIVGAPIGIDVINNASPTILNNIIAQFLPANLLATAIGIFVDSTSGTTVVGESVYENNAQNLVGVSETNAIVLAKDKNLPLFVNAAANNFYLAEGTAAIDSSVNSLPERPQLVAVDTPLGVPPSPIQAPNYDLLGQLRVDDPNVSSPPGLGSNVFKDRGAIERADFTGPTAALINPLDNDSAGIDRNPAANQVLIVGQQLTNFSIQLSDTGVGVDDLSVDVSKFVILRNGVALIPGTDYTLNYDNTNKIAQLIPPQGVWADGTYTIKLNNSNSTAPIQDLAGNGLRPNADAPPGGGPAPTQFVIQQVATAVPAWQNPINRFDVNNDGFISGIDALLIIDSLVIAGPRPLHGTPTVPPDYYYDINGDGLIGPQDLLAVIDYLDTFGVTAAARVAAAPAAAPLAAAVTPAAVTPAAAAPAAATTVVTAAAPTSALAFSLSIDPMSSQTSIASASNATTSAVAMATTAGTQQVAGPSASGQGGIAAAALASTLASDDWHESQPEMDSILTDLTSDARDPRIVGSFTK